MRLEPMNLVLLVRKSTKRDESIPVTPGSVKNRMNESECFKMK